MNKGILTLAVTAALYASAGVAFAQEATGDDTTVAQRSSVTTTSNTTNSNATQRARQLDTVKVSGQSLSLGGGNMQVQDAPKAVSTIGREAILKAAPGANFTQMLSSIPGAVSATNDVTGLNDGNFSVRGYPPDEVGVTVNGVPINDSGNYKMYATEYGDTENMGDITVEQGYPSVTSPVIGAAGGNIAWVTVDPTHDAGLDFSQSAGSNGYHRTFLRYNTGDTGPLRSWISYSNNETSLWRGSGKSQVTKVDAKSVWTIDDANSITGSLQYNREFKNNYRNVTKAQAAQNYHFGYDGNYTASAPGNYAYMQTNPFRSWILSLDGEFTLTDTLHLSVVPYMVYGQGGGGSGTTQGESAYGGIDANGDGDTTDTNVPVYQMFTSNTYRPGIHVKFKQDFGLNDSLEFGVLYERPRNQQSRNLMPTSVDGDPSNIWGQDNVDMLTYANGSALQTYRSYSITDTKRVFATNTWTPNDQWTVTLGGAYTWVNRKGWYTNLPDSGIATTGTSLGEVTGAGEAKYNKFTPNAGVKFQLDEKNQFYFGIGQAYRAPINTAALNYFYSKAAAEELALASSTIKPKPESSWTADLGWRFYGDQVSAMVDLYSSKFKNKQVSGTDPVSKASVYTVLDKVDVYGINGEVSYKFNDNWSTYASYSYNKSEMKDDLTIGTTTYDTDGKIMVNAPKNVGYVAVNYNQGPAWASVSANVMSDIYADWENTAHAGGYTTINLNGGWNFADAGWLKKPYVKFNIWNLDNRKAFTWASSVTTYRSSGTDTYQLLQDRTFMVTVGASFDL
jgi:iron complex outermembrane receptor protein